MAPARKVPASTPLQLVKLERASGVEMFLEDAALATYTAAMTDAGNVLDAVRTLKVESEETAHTANQLLGKLKTAAATLEAARLAEVKPLQAAERRWNEIYKRPQDILEVVEKALKTMIGAWMSYQAEQAAAAAQRARELEAKAMEEQARALDELARAQAEADALAAAAAEAPQGEVAVQAEEAVQAAQAAVEVAQAAVQETSLDVMSHRIDGNLAEAPTRGLRTGGTVTSAAKRTVWKLVDVTKLPAEFLLPNGPAITKAVAAGRQDIPGVLVYEETGLRTTASP